ncbi:MAG: GEVED domain-containing protein [Chloroflexota bacterium]|nr:GEVED domain-containing protein [Chloroflexota bacterium]
MKRNKFWPLAALVLALVLLSQISGSALAARPDDVDLAASNATDEAAADDLDFGDAPDSYGTLLINNGVYHVIVTEPPIHMGPTVDAEPDGQPSPGADGDDLNGAVPDDEDGVVLPPALTPSLEAIVTVDGGPSGGLLDAWIDFNDNGIFDHPAEHLWGGVSQALAPTPAPNDLSFLVPADAEPGLTYGRFRLSEEGNLTPTGFAPDGEVEDYQVEVQYLPGTIIVEKQTDPGGAPDQFEFTGDAAGTISDGEQIEVEGLQPGTYTSQEIVPARWDLVAIECDDDNSSGDLNTQIATFQLEAGETVICTFTNEPQLDYGDTPDSYGTLLISDGARHVIVTEPPIHMGPTVDAEPDGQPSPGADGDDLNGVPDDEDGVTLPPVLTPSLDATVTVDGGPTGGLLDAWIDFNGNGVFDHPTEHLWGGVSQALAPTPAPNDLSFLVPADAVPGLAYARFRLSTVGDLSPIGYALDGEVEDYQVEIEYLPGTIIVEKQTDPDDMPDQFEFTGDAEGTISDGEQIEVEGLQPGTYTSQETLPANWELTAIECDDDNSTGDLNTQTATFQLEAGETVICTFHNYLPLDYGDAPDSYDTLLASDGARHVIVTEPPIHMGPTVDAEPDGQPSTGADGDDLNGAVPDDEDGVTLPPVLTPSLDATVTVDGGPSGGLLDAWIDFDANGLFDHPGEQIFVSVPLGTGPNTLSFPVPADAEPGLTYGRFRLSEEGNLTPTGFAPDGEVEDYLVEIEYLPGTIIVEKQTDPDGAPDDFAFTGDAEGAISDGEQIVVEGLQPGTYTSQETVPSGWDLAAIVCDDDNSSGDLNTQTATFQLEAGETVICTFVNVQQPGTIIVEKQTDPDGAPDQFEFTGNAEGTISDGEQIVVDDLQPGTYTSQETLPANWELTAIECDDDNSTGDLNTQTATFQLEAGETVICIFHNYLPLDYGDTPDSYDTLLASDGARHVIVTEPPIHMGPTVDAEPDGQPSTGADGDDLNGAVPDDEDGVTLPPVLTPSLDATVTVDGGPSGGLLDAWIDFDANGLFDHPGEQIFVSVPLGTGPNTLSFPVPADAEPGLTYGRFRLSEEGNLTPTGFAPDGEVEDYLVEIEYLPGTIIVEKQTDPDGAPDDFAFTGDAEGAISDGEQIVVEGLQPGTYTSQETVPSGWDLAAIVCDDNNSSGSLSNRTATFRLEAGEIVKCTFTNIQRGSITIVKETDPDGGTGFEFDGDLGSFSLDDDDSRVFDDLLPGHYDVTEAVPAGWDLGSAVCTGGDGDPISDGVRVYLDPGEDIVCIFTNIKRGSITVMKETNPHGGTGFTFSGDLGSFSLDDDDNQVFGDLIPDHYEVTEIVPNGWNLDSVVCTGGDSDPLSNGVTVHLDPGEAIICTFTNVQQPNSINIVKETDPNGGTGFDFAGDLGSFSLDDGDSQVFTGLPAGDYDVTEIVPTGWDLDGVVCIGGDSDPISNGVMVHLDQDEAILCTFTNVQQAGSINIVKETDPDGGTGFDFTGDLGDFGLDDGDNQMFTGLSAGDYDVTEVMPAGWGLDGVVCAGGDSDPISNGVTIHLDSDEAILCTFTNVRLGSITIVKETDPDGGTGFDFTGDLGDFGLDDGDSQVFSNLLPDDYDVTEIVPAGWDLDSVVCTGGDSDPISNGVQVHLDPDEAIICTFTNIQLGAISIVKETEPDGGTGFDFTGDLGSFGLDDGSTQVFSNLLPDNYDVTEIVPDGWDLDGVVCTGGDSDPLSNGVTIHLDPGETIICTFTNVQRGSITIVKETKPDGGTGFDFTGDLGIFGLDDGDSQVFSNLLPDDYDVTEVVPDGWDMDGVVCTGGESDPITNGVRVHLDPGAAIVCTFSNFQPGSITIVKDTDPAGGTGFDFTGDLGSFGLDDGDSQVFSNLLPDDYEVTEIVPDGWDLDDVVCTGGGSTPINNGVRIHLDPGETIVCTFINVQIGPIPPYDHFIYLPLIVRN